MKRCLLLALLLVSLAARAQNSRGDFSLTTATGQAVSGAQVYILQQPANTSSFTPTISIFGSPSGGGAAVCGATGGSIGDPLITDQFGHACGYFSPGTYTVCYVSPLVGTQCYQDQVYNGASGGSAIVANSVTSCQINNDFYVQGCPSSCNGGTTQLDCTVIAAQAWASANAVQPVIHLEQGFNNTCNGVATNTQNRYSIEGNGMAGVGGSSILQTCAISTPTVNYGCNASGDAEATHLEKFTIDANNLSPMALYYAGQNISYLEHLYIRNANGSHAFAQIGDTSCTGGTTGSTFQINVNDIYLDGKGTAPGSWARGTVSISGGTPSVSVTTPGLYNHQNPPGYLIGYGSGSKPCSTMGTVTVNTSSSGSQFAVSSVALSGFSGCVAGVGAYVFIPDLPPAQYGIDLQFFTDATVNMLVTNAVGQKAGIRNANSANVYTGAHPYNSYIGVEDDGGGKWYGIDADSNLYMMNLTAPTVVSGLNLFYNNSTAFPGAGAFLLGNGSNGSTFFGNNLVTASANADYHQFVTVAGGPVDTGQGNWPASSIDIGSPTASPNSLNVRHVTGYQAVDDYVGALFPATSGANSNSLNRFWCPFLWNGSASQADCWGMNATASASGVPTQELLHIFPPNNAQAPVSGLFLLFDPPHNATVGGNVNSITMGPRGSYWNGTIPVSTGWNWTTVIGTGTTPTNQLQINAASCPGSLANCSISTNTSFITTGSTFMQSPQFNMPNGSFLGSSVPTTLSASRTYTFPDATGAVPVAPGSITVGNVACWKATGQLGTCSTTPTGGACTCN